MAIPGVGTCTSLEKVFVEDDIYIYIHKEIPNSSGCLIRTFIYQALFSFESLSRNQAEEHGPRQRGWRPMFALRTWKFHVFFFCESVRWKCGSSSQQVGVAKRCSPLGDSKSLIVMKLTRSERNQLFLLTRNTLGRYSYPPFVFQMC